jgi:hypothetical protein
MLPAVPQPEGEEVCFAKARLLRDYKMAVADYNRAVQVLSLRLGVLTKKEYNEIRHFSESARVKSKNARLALECHEREHGC